jgi:serine/threonine protein kinase
MSVSHIAVQSLYREDCEALHYEYEKGDPLGGGAHGQVFEVCTRRNRDCDYVLKVITYDDVKYQMSGGSTRSLDEVKELWKKEVRVMKKLNACQRSEELVFSPILYDAWKCRVGEKTYFYILMEKYEGSLYDIFEKYSISELLENYVLQILKTMRAFLSIIHTNCRICMNDIKLENILYKRIGSRYEFVFADFGISTENSDDECIKEDKRMFQYTIERFERLLSGIKLK